MGCFNKIGFHSKLPIKYGDEIVMFICFSHGHINDDTPCYFNTLIITNRCVKGNKKLRCGNNATPQFWGSVIFLVRM